MVWLSCLNRVPLWRLEQCSDGILHLALLTSDWRSRYGNSSGIKWSWETSISFVSICPKFRQMRSTGQKMNNNGVWNVLESKNNSKQSKPVCCYIFLQIICCSSKTGSLRNWLIGVKSQAEDSLVFGVRRSLGASSPNSWPHDFGKLLKLAEPPFPYHLSGFYEV